MDTHASLTSVVITYCNLGEEGHNLRHCELDFILILSLQTEFNPH